MQLRIKNRSEKTTFEKKSNRKPKLNLFLRRHIRPISTLFTEEIPPKKKKNIHTHTQEIDKEKKETPESTRETNCTNFFYSRL